MEDIIIFSFGLAVTLIVGSGLVTLIVTKNRIKEATRRRTEEARRAADSDGGEGEQDGVYSTT